MLPTQIYTYAIASLTFMVTAFDALGHSRVIAATETIHVAWAAYSAALPKQTAGRLMLHQGARVIAQHPADENLPLLPAR